MKPLKTILRILKAVWSGSARLHFSQYGEDILLHKRFRKPSTGHFYVDIGAHHPYHLSNTAYLWSLGWSGVNVDASQAVIEAFKSARPDDLNIQAAIVSEAMSLSSSTIAFYSDKAIDNCATCDPVIAQERGLTNVTVVPCLTLREIVERANTRLTGKFGLLNIDIEGLDDEVIQSMDTWLQKPQIVMIEIYGEAIPDLLTTRTYRLLTESGYLFTERFGHTAVFELRAKETLQVT